MCGKTPIANEFSQGVCVGYKFEKRDFSRQRSLLAAREEMWEVGGGYEVFL